MYLRILRKDLKRKKTMNIILLIFILLSATFIASSVNNIVTVSTALDYFFEKVYTNSMVRKFKMPSVPKAGEESFTDQISR